MAEQKSFWTTLPGILTGLTGLITAMGGFLVVLHQIGIIGFVSDSVKRPTENASIPKPAPEIKRPNTSVVVSPSKPAREIKKPNTSVVVSPIPIPQSNQSTGFRVVETLLRADPFNYVGPCPVKITFKGRISVVGGRGIVSYKFLRSDRASGQIKTLKFDRPGSKNIETTWTLGAKGSRFNPYKGWQAIKIFDPKEQESRKSNFSITCK